MKLNLQLSVIYQHIQANNYQTIADVGSDHGKLPMELLKNQFSGTIYITDISQIAINKLQPIFAQYKNVHCFQADGLQKFTSPIDFVVIAGLGAKTILNILLHDQPKFTRYCFQTMQEFGSLRQWIKTNNYFILEENIIENKGFFYQTIIVDKQHGYPVVDFTDLYLGPILKQQKTPTLIRFCQKKLAKNQQLLTLPISPTKKLKLQKINQVYQKILK